MSPQARKAASRKAYLTGAVRAVVRHRDLLTREQRDQLLDALLEDLDGAA
jgi:hypothetical protein